MTFAREVCLFVCLFVLWWQNENYIRMMGKIIERGICGRMCRKKFKKFC